MCVLLRERVEVLCMKMWALSRFTDCDVQVY